MKFVFIVSALFFSLSSGAMFAPHSHCPMDLYALALQGGFEDNSSRETPAQMQARLEMMENRMEEVQERMDNLDDQINERRAQIAGYIADNAEDVDTIMDQVTDFLRYNFKQKEGDENYCTDAEREGLGRSVFSSAMDKDVFHFAFLDLIRIFPPAKADGGFSISCPAGAEKINGDCFCGNVLMGDLEKVCCSGEIKDSCGSERTPANDDSAPVAEAEPEASPAPAAESSKGTSSGSVDDSGSSAPAASTPPAANSTTTAPAEEAPAARTPVARTPVAAGSSQVSSECANWLKWRKCAGKTKTNRGRNKRGFVANICNKPAECSSLPAGVSLTNSAGENITAGLKSLVSNNNKRDCNKLLAGLKDDLIKRKDFETRLAELENKKNSIEKDFEDRRDNQLLGRNSQTEAGANCFDCHLKRLRQIQEVINPPPTGWEILGRTLTTLGGAYLGYRGIRHANKLRDRQGFSAQPGLAAGLAYPFVMAGLYGGGLMGNSASMACSPTAFHSHFQNGVFNNPFAMIPGGGGVILPGMPGGGFGGFGIPGGGFGIPGGGFGLPGMIGGGGLFVSTGNFVPGGGFGIPGGGFAIPGGGFGIPGGGFGLPGMIGGGGLFVSTGNFVPGGGFGLPGMIGGGGLFVSTGNFVPGGGFAVPGGMMGGGGLFVSTGNFVPGGGFAVPGGMMGGMMAQYQHQMQAYMDYQQAQMSYRMSQIQNWQQKQKIASGLSQEIFRLQMQIQQIMYGSSGGSFVLAGAGGGGGVTPAGSTNAGDGGGGGGNTGEEASPGLFRMR